MKLILQVLFVAAMSCCLEAFKFPAVGSGELAKDFNDIFDFVPMEKFREVVKAYAAKDREFQASMSILSSEELGSLLDNVEAAPEVAGLLYFMQNAGLDVYYIVQQLNAHINFLEGEGPSASNVQITGGLDGLAKDLEALLPLEEMYALVDKKLAAGGAFAEYFKKCTDRAFLQFYTNSYMNVHARILVRMAEMVRVDSKTFENLLPVLVVIRAFVV